MPSIQLQGKIFLRGTIHARTGLHIGGNSGELDIGGIDNPVIRNAFNRQPYIPGSSLRGKMRGLLDRHFNNALEKRVGRDVRVHECQGPHGLQDVPCLPSLRGCTTESYAWENDADALDRSRYLLNPGIHRCT